MSQVARLPGRPRRPGVDDAVLAAAIELVTDQGYAGTTIDAIARRASVAKTTIYRRWRSKEALAVDALVLALGELPPLPEPGAAAVEEAIEWLAGRIQQAPVRALLLGLVVQAAHDAETRGRLDVRFREPFVTAISTRWQLARSAVDVAFDIVVGGLLHRLATCDQIGPEDTRVFTEAASNVLFDSRGAPAEADLLSHRVAR